MAHRSRGVGRRAASSPRALVLDADGLTKAAGGDPRVRAYVTRARETDADIFVSTLTLTETLRGKSSDAKIHGLLKGAYRVPVSEDIARAAGELLGTLGRRDAVDAVVSVTAHSLESSVLLLTSDPKDLGELTQTYPRVQVVCI